MTRFDSPFDEEFLDYARNALALAGIEPDCEMLQHRQPSLTLVDRVSERGFYYENALKTVPQSDAHWEQAEFFRSALRAALQDVQSGKVSTFEQFEYLYVRILGHGSARFLPMLFAAACLSPTLDREFGLRLLATLPDDLD